MNGYEQDQSQYLIYENMDSHVTSRLTPEIPTHQSTWCHDPSGSLRSNRRKPIVITLAIIFVFLLISVYILTTRTFTERTKQASVPISNAPATISIVNGDEAQKGEFPYIVSLQVKANVDGVQTRHHVCGGTIIHPRIIITAAHCFPEDINIFSPADYYVVAGDHILEENEETEQIRTIEEIVIHQDYDLFHVTNDIAIAKLFDDFNYSSFVQPVELPKKDYWDYVANRTVRVSGWGSRYINGNPDADVLHNSLHKVTLPIVEQEECKYKYGDDFMEGMICSGYPEGGSDACVGDSGGPMVSITENPSDLRLIGIVSWGDGCGKPDSPGIYTDVAYYADWIESVIEGIMNS